MAHIVLHLREILRYDNLIDVCVEYLPRGLDAVGKALLVDEILAE
jgi:hypothetical protein